MVPKPVQQGSLSAQSLKKIFRKRLVWLLLSGTWFPGGSGVAGAQALLPAIQLEQSPSGILIEWNSRVRGVRQIGIQRSMDSVFNFSTIGYARDPGSYKNRFLDAHPLAGRSYYKLIIILQSGQYYFSRTAMLQPDPSLPGLFNGGYQLIPGSASTLSGHNPLPTLKASDFSFRPSPFVFTNPDGNVNLRLPQPGRNHYAIQFFDSSGTRLFSLNHITEAFLVIDKSNFFHSGWFNYTLFKGKAVEEKWRFFIPDDPPVVPVKPRPRIRHRRRR